MRKIKFFKSEFYKDNLLLQVYLLMFICLLLLFSVSKGIVTKEGFFMKQCLWIILSTITCIFIKRVDYREYKRFAPVLYMGIIFLLILVLFIGHGRALRWIRIGWFNFQPSEFAKLILIITLSSYLAERDLKRLNVFFVSLIITGIPFFLILKQPNLGTAFIFLVISLGILYRAGISKKQCFTLLSTVVLLSPVLWFSMKGYQKERILTFLNPQRDPLGRGYNLLQSKITIGSGGLIGKGFLQGTQTKLAFLPEYHTDFVFCLLAEEFGFIGIAVLLGIYYFFLMTILKIISSTQERFTQLVGTGILTMFLFQALINVGMTVGLFPIAGIPLPFISYGGSSLIISLISVIILANIKENSTMF